MLKNIAKKYFYYRIDKLPKNKAPNHVLIIPDGNGRWAAKLDKDVSYGHKKGFEKVKKIIREMEKLPINILTLWAFSSDNWKRTKKETDSLMNIYEIGIYEAIPEMLEKNVRFICIGRRNRIPKSLIKAINIAEEKTKKLGPKTLCIAIDFSGQDQEIRMMEKTKLLPKNKKIDLYLITKLRDAEGLIPPADLVIRTSGEMRTSDLGWLVQNSEFYSIKKNLPDTNAFDFLKAIEDYTKRERRFGARIK